MRSIVLTAVLTALLACSGGEAEGGSEPVAPSPAAPATAPAAAAPEPPGDEEEIVVGQTIEHSSGLKITHQVVGTGERPRAQNRVTVHYHGTFPDGTVFDSSVERGQPAKFPLRRVIRCCSSSPSPRTPSRPCAVSAGC